MKVPEGAKALLLIFPGGDGSGDFNGRSNLYDNLPLLQIGVATIATPINRLDFGGDSGAPMATSRTSTRVIGYIRKKYKLPVWLIGHSSGAISVGYLASNAAGKIDGAVFSTSDLLWSWLHGKSSVTHMDLDNIQVPVLAVPHKLDACRLNHGGNMPKAAAKIVGMAKNASDKTWC